MSKYVNVSAYIVNSTTNKVHSKVPHKLKAWPNETPKETINRHLKYNGQGEAKKVAKTTTVPPHHHIELRHEVYVEASNRVLDKYQEIILETLKEK